MIKKIEIYDFLHKVDEEIRSRPSSLSPRESFRHAASQYDVITVKGVGTIPAWFAVLHEDIHDELGHQTNITRSRAQAIKDEKDVWSVAVPRLVLEGRWTKSMQTFAVHSLGNYTGSRMEARRFIQSLSRRSQ